MGELIEELSKFPRDGEVWAYEGEVTGVIVADRKGKHELGYVPCKPNQQAAAIIHPKRNLKGKR